MIDHKISPQRRHRPVRKAETHHHNRHPCRARRRHIRNGIANKSRILHTPPGRLDRRPNMPRIRLWQRHGIKPKHRIKARRPAQRINQRLRQSHRLVGAHSKLAPRTRQPLKRCLHPGKRPGFVGNMPPIIVQKARHTGLDKRRLRRPACQKPSLQQLARTMSHHMPHTLGRHRRPPKHSQRVVQRQRQIGSRVDKRPVQIKNDG